MRTKGLLASKASLASRFFYIYVFVGHCHNRYVLHYKICATHVRNIELLVLAHQERVAFL